MLVELKDFALLREVKMESPGVDFHGLLDREWAEGFVSKYYFVIWVRRREW